MAVAFVAVTKQDISPGSSDAYLDIDVNSYGVPADATGVWVQVLCNYSSGDVVMDIRKNGSTDTGFYATVYRECASIAYVGTDANGVLEVKSNAYYIKGFYLLGYMVSPVTMFTNAEDKSTSTTGSYVDVDVSAICPSSTMVFLQPKNVGHQISTRKNGSSDDYTTRATDGSARGFLVGVDASQIFEQKIDNTGSDLYAMGYYDGTKVTMNTNIVSRATATEGSYVDVTALPEGALVGLYHVHNTYYAGEKVTLRKNGTSDDLGYYDIKAYCRYTWPVECDTNRVIEQKIEDDRTDLYEAGYAALEVTTYLKTLSQHVNAVGTVPSRTVARLKALSQHLHAIGTASPRSTTRTLGLHVHASGTIPARITERLKTLSGVVNIGGILDTLRSKLLAGRVVTSSVASRAIGKTLSTYTVARSTIGRAIERRLVTSVSVTGTILRGAVKLKSLLGGVVTSGAVARATSRTLSIVTEVRGTISRFPQKVLSKGAVVSGTIGRSITRSLSTSVGVTATVARQFVISKTLAARSVVSGVSSRVTSRILSARSVVGGYVSRIPSKILLGQSTTSAAIGRSVARTIGSSVLVTGTISNTKIMFRTLVGSVLVTPSLVTTARKIIVSTVGVVAGTIRREIQRTISTRVTVLGTLTTLLMDVRYAMNRTLRRIFGRVQITYTDPFFAAGVEESTNGTGRYTYEDQTTDNVTEQAFPWFSLHRNVLDGSYHPLPGNKESSVGWWGTQLSDVVTGEFSVPYPTLTIEHASRTVAELQVVGDDKLGEYPVDFTIKLYDSNGSLVHTETVTGNTLVDWTLELAEAHATITRQTLEILKWSRPGAVSKVAQFFTMLEETYEGDDIVSLRVLEQRQGDAATIPQGNIASSEITVKLNNIDGTFSPGNVDSRLNGLLLNNRAIRAWLGVDLYPSGVRKWYPLGTFYSRDWNAPDREIWAEVTGLDMLDRLRTTSFSTSEVYEDKTLTELAVIILTDAGLTDADWEIDSALDTVVVPYAWFDVQSHRDALQKIAAAAMGQVYCNRDGKIVLEVYAPSLTSSFTYDGDNVFEFDHPIRWSEMVNHVEVQATPRVPLAEEDLIVDVEEILVPAGESVTKMFFFTQSPCLDVQEPTIVGGADITVTAWTAYSFGVSVTLTNAGGVDESVTEVTIRGKVLDFGASRVVTAEDTDSIARNGLQTTGAVLTSEFWQDDVRAEAVANLLLGTYKDPRRGITMRARGNIAQLLGDTVTAPETLVGPITERLFSVMSQDITWDGGMEVLLEGVAAGGPVLYHKTLEANVKASGSLTNNALRLKTLVAKVSARGIVSRFVTIIERVLTALTGDGQAERYYASSYAGDMDEYVDDWPTADSVTTNLTYLDLYVYYRYYSSLYRKTVRRGYVYFPTDTIPSGATLSLGTLRLYVSNVSDYPGLGRYCSPLYVSDGQPNYPTESGGVPALAVGDYANSKYTTRTSIARDDVVEGEYNELDVLSWVKKAVRTKFRLTQTSTAGSDYVALYYRVDSAEGTNPPELVVSYTYTEGGS